MLGKYKATASFIQKQIDFQPEVGVILGSGLGNFIEKIRIVKALEYSDIPNFPLSTVEGHSGRLILGELGEKYVMAMQGRFHYYEGYSMDEVTFPVRVMKLLGVKYLMVSNAAGGLNPDYRPGDLMMIDDHINFFPNHPLLGPNIDSFGVRFPDMSKTYDPEMRKKAAAIAEKHHIKLQSGIYIGSSGPTLETPAEYRMFRIWGADATGMSTVPEIIVAHHAGLRCFGISIITNASQKETQEETTHQEVQDVAGKAEPQMTTIFSELIASL